MAASLSWTAMAANALRNSLANAWLPDWKTILSLKPTCTPLSVKVSLSNIHIQFISERTNLQTQYAAQDRRTTVLSAKSPARSEFCISPLLAGTSDPSVTLCQSRSLSLVYNSETGDWPKAQ